MTPQQFLAHLKKQTPAPAYLFLGPEPYRRSICRRALIEKVLGAAGEEQGLTVYDLQNDSLNTVIDDAWALSLFAARRLIWVSNAEAALPRGKSAGGDDSGTPQGAQAVLEAYMKKPTPGVVVVLDVARFDLEGEDKARMERVRKFFSAVRMEVLFPRFTIEEARRLAADISERAGLEMDPEAVEWLVDAVAADAMRIASEIEKLSLFAAGRKKIGLAELADLVPDSSVSTIFTLVDALARRDRMRSLELVDVLTRQGEYMPLALNFLASLMRLALAARQKGFRSPQQIQQAFSRPGRPVWRAKAEQIHRVASALSEQQLEDALKCIFEADAGLRDVRPSDRLVVEKLVFALTT